MAEGTDDIRKGLKDLEKEITCGICQEHYHEPKLLACGHYYCKQCLVKLSLRACEGEPVNCPECRLEVALSNKSVDNLNAAFNVNRLKDTYKSLLQAFEKDKVESSEVACDEIRGESKKCKTHDDFLLLFCYDCKQLICRDCGLTDHKTHKIEYNSIAVPKKKEELVQSSKHFKAIEDDFKQAILEVNNIAAETKARKRSVAIFMMTYFNKLHDILKKCEQSLLKLNQESAARHLARLKAQEKQLSDACADLRSVMEATEQHLSTFSDDHILCMSSHLDKQISEKKATYSFRRDSLDKNRQYLNFGVCPANDTFLEVNVKLPLEFGSYCNELVHCKKMKMLKNEVSCREMKQDVFCKTRNSFKVLYKKQGKMKCYIAYLQSHKSLTCDISRIGSCTYHVEYVAPRLSGQYNLHVLVDGKDIHGSPFPLSVS